MKKKMSLVEANLRAEIKRIEDANRLCYQQNLKLIHTNNQLAADNKMLAAQAQLQTRRVKFLTDRVASLEVTVFTTTRLMTESRKAASEHHYNLNLDDMPSILTRKPAVVTVEKGS